MSLTLSLLLALPLAIFLPSAPAFAADTGFMSPAATGGDHNQWATPGNAFASDEAYATETTEGQDQSYENFGFSIPVGAIITGVEMSAEAKSSDASGCRLEARLWSESDNEHTDLRATGSVTGSDALYTLGSSSDLWGSTWMASDFSNTNFHAQIAFDDLSGSLCSSATFSVDQVQVKVHYTPPVENPPLAQACGLDMALVIDSSGSIDSTELATMKSAFNSFVDAFLPATPTEMAVVEFDSTATVTQGFTDDETLLHTAVNAAASGGLTNWDDALFDARSLFPNRAANPDVIVFASDGNPTASDGPLSHLEDAIVEANAAKTDGIHIIALGIGGDLDADSLAALSYPDSVIISDFGTLAADLAALAEELCGGTITVHKIIDADGDLSTVGDQTNGSGWTFTTNVDADDGDSSTPPSGDTDSDGMINFDINLGANDSSTVDVSETVEPGYAAISASCESEDGSEGTPGSDSVTDIVLGSADIVSCTFYNAPAGKIIVEKQTEPDGSQESFEFDSSWGSNFFLSDGQQNDSGDIAPGTYSVAEVLPSGWQLTGVVCSDGSLPDAIGVLAGETVTCVFTNTIDELCEDNGNATVINENSAYVVNGTITSSNSGDNSASGGAAGSAGDGGDVVSSGDENTGGNGGEAGNGGNGGTVLAGEAGAGTDIVSSVNYNETDINRCGCCCGGSGDDTVLNSNLGFLASGALTGANTGSNMTDGGSTSAGGTGGSVVLSDDDNIGGNGGGSGSGGTGGTVYTSTAMSLTGVGSSVNTNITRIRR